VLLSTSCLLQHVTKGNIEGTRRRGRRRRRKEEEGIQCMTVRKREDTGN